MRVSAETKQATRASVLKVAQELFWSRGFHETTSRELAAGVGIAAGTIFNYFPSKEAIVVQLMADALARAEQSFPRRRRKGGSVEEDVFLYISTGLRQLLPLRGFIAPALETHIGPASAAGSDDPAGAIRMQHLETVSLLLTEHGLADAPTAMQLQMYWLLYTGVLAFWAKDTSRKQEDTLALTDQSVRMFITWLGLS